MSWTNSQKWIFFAAIVVTALFIYLLAPVLTPFLIAAFIAYLTDPLVEYLQRFKIPRILAVVIVFLFIFALVALLLVILIPMLEEQILALVNKTTLAIDWIQLKFLPYLEQRFGIEQEFDIAQFKQQITGHWQQAGGIVNQILSTVTKSGLAIMAGIANAVLIPVVLFYLLRDWHKLIGGIHNLLPRPVEPTVTALVKECDVVLSAFIRGQLLVMIGLGILYSIGLWIVGIELALLIGMTAGLLSIVPYLGFIVGIIAALIAAFMQFHDGLSLVYVVLVFVIVQAIEGTMLTPILVGDKIGLHPVAVIFAILVGSQLFGFVGILLALPVAAVLMVFIRYFQQQYLESQIYQAAQEE